MLLFSIFNKLLQNNWLHMLLCLDPPTIVYIKPKPERPTLPASSMTTVQLHCITDEYNGNCSISWNTGSVNTTQPDVGQYDQPVNITVDRNNIGTHVTCTVSCDLIDTNISAIYTVVADCKFYYGLILS